MSQNSRKMTSFNPYIFRAFYDWLVDNQITPHLVVNADKPRVEVPREYVRRHTIILSISPKATCDFHIGSQGITFSARFNGQERFVSVPYRAMQELFAVETSMSYPIGLWMGMENESEDEEQAAEATGTQSAAAEAGTQEASAQFATVEFSGSSGDDAGADGTAADKDKNEPLPSFTLVGSDQN